MDQVTSWETTSELRYLFHIRFHARLFTREYNVVARDYASAITIACALLSADHDNWLADNPTGAFPITEYGITYLARECSISAIER
jgi:hypothetical protein